MNCLYDVFETVINSLVHEHAGPRSVQEKTNLIKTCNSTYMLLLVEIFHFQKMGGGGGIS